MNVFDISIEHWIFITGNLGIILGRRSQKVSWIFFFIGKGKICLEDYLGWKIYRYWLSVFLETVTELSVLLKDFICLCQIIHSFGLNIMTSIFVISYLRCYAVYCFPIKERYDFFIIFLYSWGLCKQLMARKVNGDSIAFGSDTFVLGQVLFTHVWEAQMEECKDLKLQEILLWSRRGKALYSLAQFA